MATPAKSSLIRFGVYEFEPFAGELRKQGMRIRLEGQPIAILRMLLERPGELVTREELQKKLWPADTFVDFEHSLNAVIKRLRAALNDSAEHPRYIETLARRGYRFIAPVDSASTQAEGEVSVLTTTVAPSRARASLLGHKLWAFAAIGVVVVAIWGWQGWRNRAVPAVPVIHSLAVLPLENLSGDPSQEYLADGMTEELIGRLAQIRDLRVISRTSVMQFKNTKLSAREIARTLGVDALVEGSVIREGNRIRVHAQLIRGATDEHFWSQAYDRELRDVLSLESEVAQSIARKVEVTVTGKEQERLTAARSVSPEVYESYLKGRSAYDKSNSRGQAGKAGIEESIRYFEEAIKKDPSFAPAYVGLATAYRRLGAVLVGVPPTETRPKVISAAQKALEIDPELAEAHARLADIYQTRFQWSDAEAEYKRALELKPNDAATHRIFAIWLVSQGRTEEAVAWSRRGRELDPLGTSGSSLGFTLFYARHYDEAMHELRSVLTLRPDDAEALWYLGFVLIAKGLPDEAIPVLEKGVSVSDRSPAIISILIRAYAHAGRRADALRLLAELKGRKQAGYVTPAAFVNAYLGLGEYDEAFAWLEQAYREQSNSLQFLKVQPFYDPIRGDPRFKDLVHRVGLD